MSLPPEEVDHAFRAGSDTSKTKFRAIPGWPYLGNVPLDEARPEHVQRLIAAAQEHGYSAQTVAHIRNVVRVVFDHASKKELHSAPTSQAGSSCRE